MSNLKFQPPVIHTPSFKRWATPRAAVSQKIEALGLQPLYPGVHETYFFTDVDGGSKLLPNLILKSDLYKPSRFTCNITPELAFAFGLFFAEGYVGFPKLGFNWDISNTNPDLLQLCIEPLRKEWGIKFKITSYPSEKAGTISGHGIRHKTLYHLKTDVRGNRFVAPKSDFIREFRNMFYCGKEKIVPHCILGSPLEIKQAFLEGAIEGDGYKKERRISQKSGFGTAGLGALAYELGWKPHIRRDNYDLFCLDYSLRDKYDAFIARYLMNKGWVPIHAVVEQFQMNFQTMIKILRGLEREGFIVSRKPSKQRREIKLVKTLDTQCINYAFRVWNTASQRYGLNTWVPVIGRIPNYEPRHAWILIMLGDEDGLNLDDFLYFEPNQGWEMGVELEAAYQAFPIGQEGYHGELIFY